MKAAGISTVEDLLGVVKIAQACKELEAETGVSIQDVFKLCHRKNSDKNGCDSSSVPLSKEYIDVRDRILKKNKELYERLS